MALTRSAGLKGTHAIDVKSLDTAKDEAPHLVAYVSKLSACNLPALVKYVNIVKEYALVVSNPLGMYMLLEICSITPMNSTEQLFDHIEWLKVSTDNTYIQFLVEQNSHSVFLLKQKITTI